MKLMTQEKLERANDIQEELEWMTTFLYSAKSANQIRFGYGDNSPFHQLEDERDPEEIRDFIKETKIAYMTLLEELIQKRQDEFNQL